MADINVKVKVDRSELDDFEKKTKGKDVEIDTKVSGQEDVKQTTTNVEKMTTAAQKSNGVFASLKGKISETFSSANIATTTYLGTLYGIQKAGSAAVKSIEEIDSAIVDLQIATNGTYEDTKKLVASYNEIGQALAANTVSVSNSASEWIRQGHSIEDTNTLIRDSMILSKVANLDSASSTEYLTSAMKGYGVETENVIGIVDKLCSVDLLSATSADGLAEAMARTAVTADMAGVSMDKLLGYLAVTGETTQRSMSSIGEAFKTIFTRMSDIKSNKLELVDEDGTTELLSDVELTLSKVGIDLRKTVTEYNSYSDVLDNLAAKWDTLNQTQQNALSKAFAGTRQAEFFRILMKYYSNAEKYTEASINSSGMAEKKFDAYLNSIAAKKEQIQASFESLIFNTDAQEVYKSILDITNSIVQLTDKANLLKVTFGGIIAAGVIKGFTSLKTGIMGAYVELNNFNNALKLSKQTSISTDGFNQLLSLTKNLSDNQTKLILSSANLSQQQKINILTNQGLSEAEAVTRLNTLGLSSANQTAAKSTKSLSNAMGGFLNTIKANPVGAITAAVTAAVMVYNLLKKVVDEHTINIEEAQDATKSMIDSFQSAKSEAEENADTIKSIKNEYASLMKEVNQYTNTNISLSTEDYERYLELTNQIAEIFPDLVKGYDSEGNAILNLAGDINTLVDAYEKAQKAAYALAFTGSEDIENSGFESVVKSYLSETSKTGSWWDNFWKKFGHKFTNQRDVGIDLSYQEAVEELQTFINADEEDIAMSRNMDLHVIADSLGVSYGDVFNATGKELQQLQNQAQTVVNTYQEIMNSALSDMQTAAEGYLKGLNSTYDDLTEEQQNLASVIVSNMPKDVADAIANSTNSEQALRNWVSDIVELIENSGDDITGIYKNITESLSDTTKLDTEGLDQITAQIEKLSNLTGVSVDDYKDIFGIDELYKSLNTKVQSVKTIARDLNIDLADILGEDKTQKPSLIDLSQLKAETGEFGSIANTYVGAWGQLQEAMSAYQIEKDSFITNNEFLSQVDTYITKTNELQDALTNYKNGDFSNSDVSDLIKKFPELEGHTDNLSGSIVGLIGNMNTDMVNKFGEQFGKLDSKEDIEALQHFQDAVLELGSTVGSTEFSIDIDAETEGFENFYTAMKESVSSTGLTSDSITNLKERYADLESQGYDVAGMFEKTENGIHLNTKALRELESAYESQYKENIDTKLDSLVNEYNTLTTAIDNSSDAARTAELYAQRNEIQQQIEDTSVLAAQYDGLTSAFYKWEQAQSIGEEGDMYDSLAGSLEDIKELYKEGLIGTNEFRAAVQLMSNEDLSTANIDQLLDAYESGYSKMTRYFTDSSDGCLNFLNDVQKLNSEWAHMNEDGSWEINFGVGGDEEIAEKLGINVESIQAIMRKLSDYGFDINLDSIYSSLDYLQSEAEKANDKLKELGATDYTFNFNTTDIDYLKEQITEAQSALDIFRNSDGTVNLTMEGAEEAQSILEALIYQKQSLDDAAILSVDTSNANSEIETVIGKLQEFKSSYNNLEVQTAIGADTTQAKADVDAALASLSEEHADIIADLGIDTTSADAAIESINALTPEVMVTCGLDASLIEGYQEAEHTTDGEVIWDNNISKVTEWINESHIAKGTVDWENNIDNVKTKFTATGTINWTNKGSGGAAGTAHAQGTAKANGDWGTKESGTALGGELGQELVVRDGRFFTIGDKGAEFFKYKKGDIIFNADQTKEIFEKGRITANSPRGRLYYTGTAFSNGTGKITASGKVKTTASGNKSSSSSSSTSDTADEFEEKLDWIETLIDRIERAISSLDIKASSIYKNWSTRNSALKSEMSEITNEINVQKQAYNRYLQEANNVGLSESWAKLVREGKIDITTITDEDLADKIKEYQEYYEAALDCKDAVEELSESLSECYETAFDNVVTQYDSILSVIEFEKNLLDEYISQTEESGYITSTKYYEALMKTEQNNIAQMQKEKSALEASLNTAVASGAIAKESEAWYKMCQEINDVTLAIEEANTAMIEYGNSIRDIEWEVFDLLQDKISRITTEADFLIDLLSNDKLYDDHGQLTNEGLATMGLHGVDYNTYMAQADKYAEEMLKIDKELANDPYNQDLIDRKEELLELQQESILAAEDEKQAIKEMIKEGIELELDALDELIAKYKDVINNAKDLFDYQKKINDYTEEITSLEKQLQAYSGDNSEEAKTKIQQITVDLKEARENLEATQYDKFIEDSEKLLDELYSEYEQILNERLDNIDALIADMINEINLGASTISDTLSAKAESVGYTLSDNMTAIWDTNSTKITDVLTIYGTNFVNAITTVNSTLGTINTNIQSMITQLNTIANTKTTSASTASAAKSAAASGTASTSTATKSTTASTSSSSSNSSWGSWFVKKKSYYDKSKLNKEVSIVDRLAFFDYDPAFAQRKNYYYAMGGSGVYTGSASQNTWMISEMKKHGFKGGGTIGELIDRTGETGFILAHTGEEVLSLEKIKALGDAFERINPVVDNLNTLLPVLPSSNSVNTSNSSNNIDNMNIEITLPNVTNYDEFRRDLQTDDQFVKWMRAETTGQLSPSKNSFSGRRYIK